MSHTRPDCWAEGFNTAMRIPNRIAHEVVRQEGDLEALDLLSDDDEVCSKITELLLSLYSKAKMTRFKLDVVDYTTPLEQQFERAGLEVDPNINLENFEIEKRPNLFDVEVGLIHPKNPSSTQAVIQSAYADRYPLGDLPHGLAFSTKYREVQLEHRVVCAGSVGKDPTDHGKKVIPCLGGEKDTQTRTLGLECLDESIWNPPDHFLVVLPPARGR